MRTRARFIVPEVVQTSNLDCGPAALKALLEGFGIRANYGRLREACQTDVDGTSIDAVEEAARQLGLEAEQIVVPADHVLLEEARTLPAIAVVVLPSGLTHFVVVWRKHGRFVQIMDPAAGRRWLRGDRFLGELYLHTQPAPAADWRAYAGSSDFLAPLRRRIDDLGLKSEVLPLLSVASADPDWNAIAAVDAAVRMTAAVVRSGAARRGRQAERVLEGILNDPANIPARYCSAWHAPSVDGPERVFLRGAVLVRVLGRRRVPAGVTRSAPASPELAAALEQAETHPGRDLLRLLRADGVLKPAMILGGLLLASTGVLVEAALFRGLLNLGGIGLKSDRAGAVAAVIVFSFALLVLDLSLAGGLLRLGRRLETRLRLAFLRKLPRLGDRYFQSRLKSDMAERSHGIHLIRQLPELGGQLVRATFELILTAAGIAWLDPSVAPIAFAAAFAAAAVPLLAQPLLMERDLRLRTHAGALSHFYLDALLGLVAIHAHGAEPAVRRQHETLLGAWARAGLSLQRMVVGFEAVQFVAGFALAIWLLSAHLAHGGATGAILLLVYWALNLPALGQDIALIAWQYPSYRNITLRLLEPLGAIERRVETTAGAAPPATTEGVSIAMRDVVVRAAGHTILSNIDLSISAGSHVAIVGPSGAGKSSLVGVLLGWHRPVAGAVLVDGAPLDETRLDTLRREIGWVDPGVQLWNRPLADNLRYGASDSGPLDDIVGASGLRRLIDQLPRGLDTVLGEGGGLVSGGEGQRVRLARALLRHPVRLAVLDEPFRGLDLDGRRALLALARERWRGATLLCVTHDVGETLSFDRVLVIEDGRIVEDGRPKDLAQDASSRFRAMLDAEEAARRGLWSDRAWRRYRLEDGALRDCG